MIKPTVNYAVHCAREYAKQFNTNAFAIHHLSTTLEIPYSAAKELFYNFEEKPLES